MRTSTRIALLALVFFSANATRAVMFDWAAVGNPGNPADPQFLVDGIPAFGSVDYAYRISKLEVTNAQYTEFLNSVDPAGGNALSLYNAEMSSNANGGINLNNAAANGSKYQVRSGRDNKPVIFVSFFDAMRFVNWLQNGQVSASTESGVYTIGSGANEMRNPNAIYFLPTDSEWYKAAYHKNDGVTANYWDYPTSTEATPYSDNPQSLNTPDDTNVANFFKDDRNANGFDDGYAVAGSVFFDNHLTDVGAYSMAASPYGTFDQAGNIAEWNETVILSTRRVVRGGNWADSSFDLRAAEQSRTDPSLENFRIGFRVASIPEPSTMLLGALASVRVFLRRRLWANPLFFPAYPGVGKNTPKQDLSASKARK